MKNQINNNKSSYNPNRSVSQTKTSTFSLNVLTERANVHTLDLASSLPKKPKK